MAKLAPGPIVADIDAPAAAAVVAYTFGAVNADTPSIATATSAAGNVGVITNSAATGEGTGLKFSGVCPLYVNGNSVNIAVGDYIAPTTAGYGVKDATTKHVTNAVALQAATTDGALILVLINGAGVTYVS